MFKNKIFFTILLFFTLLISGGCLNKIQENSPEQKTDNSKENLNQEDSSFKSLDQEKIDKLLQELNDKKTDEILATNRQTESQADIEQMSETDLELIEEELQADLKLIEDSDRAIDIATEYLLSSAAYINGQGFNLILLHFPEKTCEDCWIVTFFYETPTEPISLSILVNKWDPSFISSDDPSIKYLDPGYDQAIEVASQYLLTLEKYQNFKTEIKVVDITEMPCLGCWNLQLSTLTSTASSTGSINYIDFVLDNLKIISPN
ncbi:hypothetical protein K8R42_01745, partial [bacterium]|nr:hypothetical protein [bacterium]